MVRTILTTILVGALAGSLGATEFFVREDGDDSKDGKSRATAFATVQKGVDALQPGDTLTLAPGEYFGSVVRRKIGGPEAVTTIRAEIPGTAILRGDIPAPSLRKVEGRRLVYVADFKYDGKVHVVNEWDTLTIFESATTVAQLEFAPGKFHHDPEAGKLYISTRNLRPPTGRVYSVSVTGTHGLRLDMARRVVIEGLAVTGFNRAGRTPRAQGAMGAVFGIVLDDPKDCVIRDCLAYMNAQGILVNSESEGTGDNVVERCRAWSNASQIGDADRGGITLHGIRPGRRDVIRNCESFFNQQYGINIYTGLGARSLDDANKNRLMDNLAWGNFCDFKIKTGHKYVHTAERCAGPGLWSLGTASYCLMGIYRHDTSDANIIFSQMEDLDPDREFADPVNHDYRLQSTSRFRGAGPNGKDRGPNPYNADVRFVSRKGDDKADGLSVATAWRTLPRALRDLQPGDTLYLLEGEYAGGVKLQEMGGAEKPIRLRGRGQSRVVIIRGLDIIESQGLAFERLTFDGAVTVRESKSLRFDNCVFGGAGGGLHVNASAGLRVTHSVFPKTPLRAETSKGLFLSGVAFEQARQPAVILDSAECMQYADYNSYQNPAAVWLVGGKTVSLEDLRNVRGRRSRVATPAVAAALRAQGPHGAAVGRHSYLPKAHDALRLVGPYVHSVTDTTANIEWWASGPTQCHLAWGEAKNIGEEVTIDSHRAGSYSLTGLKPGVEYAFRIRLDKPIRLVEGGNAKARPVKSATVRFTTATESAEPRTYYVATNGDDANSGLSRENAWLTVSHAADRVRPGDTVLVTGGRYSESVRVRATGDRDRPITFKAAPGEKVVFDGVQGSLTHAFFAANKSWLNFDGFYFIDFNMLSDYMPWSDRTRGNTGALVLYGADHVRLTRCFHDGRAPGYSPGIIHAERSADVLVRNCVTIRSMGGGVSFAGCPGFRIEHCVFLKNLIANVSEAVNKPHQKFYMVNNIICDNIHSKQHQPFFSIGRIESMVERDNCYHLRLPDEKRRMFLFYNAKAWETAARASGMTVDTSNPPIFDGLKRMSLAAYQKTFNPFSGSFVATPGFRGARDMPEKDNRGNKYFSFDYLNGVDTLDFDDLFATHPLCVERNIGLQPAAFADFHFNRKPAKTD